MTFLCLGSRLLAQSPPPPPPAPLPGGDYSQPPQPGLYGQPAQPSAQPAQPGGDQSGPEVLTRGPIHEAFAEVVNYNPQPGPIVPQQPPQAIEEVPPAEKPAGDYIWVPGYWSWDQERNNYIWVTGAWRIPPPGTTWVPGYWNPVSNGHQWVSGYWGPAAAANSATTYLPAPPQSVEAGASTPAPSPDHFWIPGTWVWADGRYVWQAGYWGQSQPDWIWIPSRYVWTPGGYVFIAGHWDYVLARRGVVFCPVNFAGYYAPPGYRYSPTVCVETPVLTGCLFCCPGRCHYYFGDYYDPRYVQIGIYPWYAVHGRYGYEPLFVYDRWYYGRRDPGWELRIRGDYEYRVAHIDARPPRTYAASLQVGFSVGGVRVSMAMPIGRVAVAGGPMRFEHIDAARREQFVREQAKSARCRPNAARQKFRPTSRARRPTGADECPCQCGSDLARGRRRHAGGCANYSWPYDHPW